MKSEEACADAEFVPTTQDELRRFLVENHAGVKRAIAPVGGRTALDFGYSLTKPAVTVDLTSLKRVVDFPARDMTITVEAGVTIDQLVTVLASEKQRLPIDVSQSSRATLGGAITTNTSGPRRFGYGTFRDYVIGITALTADGQEFHSGGRVVKNVAGYDLCKLLVGSLGTLAIVTQVTLKLKPIAESSVLVWATFDGAGSLDAAVGDLLNSQTRPVAIDTLNPAAASMVAATGSDIPAKEWTLLIGFEGSKRETDWQADVVQKELTPRGPKKLQVLRDDAAARLWAALTEFPTPSNERLAFQARLLPSKLAAFVTSATESGIAVLSHAASGIAVGKVGDRVEQVAPLAALAERSGGNLTMMHGKLQDRGALPAFVPSGPAEALMRKLKQAFDPDDLLNPGRMFAAAPARAD